MAKHSPREWRTAYRSAIEVPAVTVDVAKLAAERPGATIGDLARAAHTLGLELHVATTRIPKKPPTKKPRKERR